MTTVRGTVRLEQRPVGGQDVLALPPDGGEVLGTARTDDTGAFTVGIDGTGRLALVAKVRTESLAVATAVVEPDGVAALDAEGPLHTVTATLESDAGFPEALDVLLDPDTLDGVPDELLRYVNQTGPGVYERSFMRRPVRGRQFAFRLQPGTWRIGGEWINYDRVHLVEPGFSNYVVEAALVDGDELPGDRLRGFSLRVDGDRSLTLRLRELADDEL